MTNERETILSALDQPLDPDLVKQREGAGGRKLDYLEGFEVINQANEIFGYDGWSMDLINIEYREHGDRGGMFFATVKVTVHALSAIVRTDVGVGTVKSNAAEEIEKGHKEAVTDGMKRAFRTFGPQFGNELYNKKPATRTAPSQQRPAPQERPMPAQEPPPLPTVKSALSAANGAIIKALVKELGWVPEHAAAQVQDRYSKPLSELGGEQVQDLIDWLRRLAKEASAPGQPAPAQGAMV